MRPLKVTLSGIDGSGKSTTASAVSRRLASEGLTVVHALRRSYVDRPGREREYFADKIHGVVDHLHQALDRRGSRLGVGLTNVVYSRIWREVEAWAVDRFEPDVVLNGRSAVLDSAVYAPFYFRPTRLLSARRRVALSTLIASPVPADLRFVLDVSADVAHRRILERIARERTDGAPDREKWTHMHETPQELGELRTGFERCVSAMQDDVSRVDASRPQSALVQEIVQAIRARVERRRAKTSIEP